MDDEKNMIPNENAELSDEELNSVAGGSESDDECPKCGSKNVRWTFTNTQMFATTYRYTCNSCGRTWEKSIKW